MPPSVMPSSSTMPLPSSSFSWFRKITTPTPSNSMPIPPHSRHATHLICRTSCSTRATVLSKIAGRAKGCYGDGYSWRWVSSLGLKDGRSWSAKARVLGEARERGKVGLGGLGVEKKEGEEEKKGEQGLMTLPTILTLGRVAAVPLLVSTFYMNGWWATTATTSIFVVAAATDWLDGYLARKMRLGSAFGAFLDPVADKLMVAATLVLLCTRPMDFGVFGELPWLLPIPAIAIISREITISAVREWAASQDSKLLESVAVNSLGKWKTATQMTALTILLASRDSSLVASEILVPTGIVLLYISAGLAVWSLVVYMKKIWRVLLR